MPKLRENEKPFVKFTTWPVHTFLMMVLTSLWTPEWISFSWFYSGVCQPLELDPWNSPKEVVPKSFQNGWQNHLDMGGFNFNDAYPTIFSWRCFWLQKDIHREFLWNWGIGRTHCWWLSAALNEQRLYQNLLPFPCLKYIWKEQWRRPWVFIVSRGLYFPGIYIYKYIERAFYPWHGWNVATRLPFYNNKSVWYFLRLRWAVKEGLPSGNFVARFFKGIMKWSSWNGTLSYLLNACTSFCFRGWKVRILKISRQKQSKRLLFWVLTQISS